MKYEAVFGDQSLFDGLMTDCEFASEMYGYMFANGILYYCARYNEKAGWSQSCKNNFTFKPSAMRRIIRIPTWTVADQKAGKLPKVGAKCRQGHKEETVIAVTENFVVTECLDGAVCTTRKCEFMASYNPIESPEEKAARLREEWCIKALSSCPITSGMQKYELKRLGGYIGDIYDALLSGELSMPSKGG